MKHRKQIKQRTKRNILLCVIAVVLILLAALLIGGVSGFMDSRVDTKEGVEYIRQEEAGDASVIEAKINRLEQQGGEEDTRSIKERFSGAVVMGDSIAQGFAEFDVLNVSSVTAQLGVSLTQFGDQIEAAKEASPSTVFLSAGMNDVIETGGDTEAFLTEFGEVLSQIRTELPGVNIFVNSILPVQQKAIDEEPLLEQIPAYNEALRTFCSSQGIGYVDNTEIVQESYYGGDGIHFTSAFYPVWAEHMAEVAAL